MPEQSNYNQPPQFKGRRPAPLAPRRYGQPPLPNATSSPAPVRPANPLPSAAQPNPALARPAFGQTAPLRSPYAQPRPQAELSPVPQPQLRPQFEPQAATARPVTSLQDKLRPLLSKKRALVAVAVIAVAIGGLSLLQPAPAFSNQLASSVKVKLYYPASLPLGYHVDQKSIQQTSDQSIQFSIIHGKSTIAVAESLASGSTGAETFVNSKLTNPLRVTTHYGEAEVGYVNNPHQGVVGSLVTGDGCWIMATEAGQATSLSSFSSLFHGFKPQ